MTEPRRNLYGRRSGPALTARRKELFAERLARFAVAVEGALPPRLDPKARFPEAQRIWLEIGFGAGEHMAVTALANPDTAVIGCEHYTAGVASALSKLDKAALRNVGVFKGDARDLMDALPAGSVERIFLLYPDPWPKTRHHKRRFVNPFTLDAFARLLPPGGEARVATDIPDYADWTREHFAAHADFACIRDSGEAWTNWPGTRYEAKALREGRAPQYLIYRRGER